MKSKEEIEERIKKYKNQLNLIKNEQYSYFEQTTCRFWIEVLEWVLDRGKNEL